MTIVSITPEIGLDELYTYAGGLGVLEGDKFIYAARNNYDYAVLTLLYRNGYVDYEFKEDKAIPVSQTHPIPIHKLLSPDKEITITMKNDEIIVRPWIYSLRNSKIVFFEPECPLWARSLVDNVYIEKNDEERYYKYILLAKAAATYIRDRIGLENIDVIDIQEAYTALIILSLPEYDNYRFITHTPGPWGHPYFPRKLLENEFGSNLDEYGENIMLTRIAMEKAKKIYTVSKKHCMITRQMFKEYSEKIDYVTNAVETTRWLHPAIRDLLIRQDASELDPDKLWNAHLSAKKDLIKLLKKYKPHSDIGMDKMFIVWARRLTRYKRPYYIANFIEEHNDKDLFFILGGKPHPNDKDGIDYMLKFRELMKKYDNVVYIHDYDIQKAKLALTGGDLLLFTPFPGWEACGTSFMKAGINGVPILASRDGGALELVRDGINSWFFGSTLKELVNIYSDEKAKLIDSKDYEDFVNRLKFVIEIFNTDKYREVMLNILHDSIKYFTMERMFAQYYPQLSH